MQITYPVGSDASTIQITAQKRLLRTVQGQTQATPTSGYLDPSLRTEAGVIRPPLSSDKSGVKSSGAAAVSPFTRSANAFTYEGSLTPGLVLVKTVGENYAIADGNAKEGGKAVFGLLGQWLGGPFDGVKQNNQISAWQGPDSQYDILAPGFNTEELATEAKKAEKGEVVPLYVAPDGRLTAKKPTEVTTVIAELVEYNPSVIRVRLLI
jgi:hypothetical protein